MIAPEEPEHAQEEVQASMGRAVLFAFNIQTGFEIHFLSSM